MSYRNTDWRPDFNPPVMRDEERRRRKRVRYYRAGLFWVLVAAVALPIAGWVASSYFHKRDVTVQVISKENVCHRSGKDLKCEYLVFTDQGTFKISDALFGTQRLNSSDIYGRILTDHCYVFTVYGWRFGFTNSYPNLAKIRECAR